MQRCRLIFAHRPGQPWRSPTGSKEPEGFCPACNEEGRKPCEGSRASVWRTLEAEERGAPGQKASRRFGRGR